MEAIFDNNPKIWAKIDVTKHVFKADEIMPYRLSAASVL